MESMDGLNQVDFNERNKNAVEGGKELAIQGFLYCQDATKMYKIPQIANTNVNNQFLEMEKMLAVSLVNAVEEKYESEDRLFDLFLSYIKTIYKDNSYHSHASYVVRCMKEVAYAHQGHGDIRQVLFSINYIRDVLDKMAPKKSFKKKLKHIFRSFYRFYFESLNYPNLSPEREQVIQIFTQYGKKDNIAVQSTKEVHPMILEMLDYISEKNQRWQRRARIQTTFLLKWLVSEGYFPSILEINVLRIDTQMLSKFRDSLDKSVKNKVITVETAQVYIQTIRRWFTILKRKGHITINPASRLRNFRVKRREDKPLLSPEELESFFRTALSLDEPLKWYLFFSLMATMGLRVSEVLEIKCEEIDIQRGVVLVHRKWHKEQWLPIPSLPGVLLKAYLRTLSDGSTGPLWFNQRGGKMSYNSVLKRFNRIISLAGITNLRGAVHNFRHLLLSELCFQNPDLSKLKVLADVNSIDSLAPYIRARDSDVFHEFQEKFLPVGVNL